MTAQWYCKKCGSIANSRRGNTYICKRCGYIWPRIKP